MKKVLITGISGFIGSYIAEAFIEHGYRIIGLKRENTNLWRCKEHINDIQWIDVEDVNWKSRLIQAVPEIIVHSAWSGVDASNRNDWNRQFDNLNLLYDLLYITREVRAKSFIGLGSQAEYGYFNEKIGETFPCNPNSAYGVSKLMAKEALKAFCEQNNINWYWLRLFPCFGEKESFDWFIPMLVKNIYHGESMDMTKGDQKYAYLYVKDLANWIFRIADKNISSDVYNISSNNFYPLKEVVEKVIRIIQPLESKINVGALPYRKNQSMILGADTQKLALSIGELREVDFDIQLEKTVRFILHNLQTSEHEH